MSRMLFATALLFGLVWLSPAQQGTAPAAPQQQRTAADVKVPAEPEPFEYAPAPESPDLVLYFADGTTRASAGGLHNGRRNGLWTFYDLQGNVAARGSYKDYEQVGAWTH